MSPIKPPPREPPRPGPRVEPRTYRVTAEVRSLVTIDVQGNSNVEALCKAEDITRGQWAQMLDECTKPSQIVGWTVIRAVPVEGGR